MRRSTAGMGFALALIALASPVGADDGVRALGVDSVEEMLGAQDVRIYDVNSRQIFERHHLPGAVHIGGRNLVTLLPADRWTRLVFYCTNPY